MTYSNGTYSAHPLANPFNTLLGPANYSLNQIGVSYIKQANTKNKSLPDPVMLGSEEWNRQQPGNDLHVPQQNSIPYGQEGNIRYQRNTNVFVCDDGTVLDIKTGKVLADPNVINRRNGYWNDPNAMTMDDSRESEWNDREIYSISIQDNLDNSLGISRKDQDYWNKANDNTNSLLSSMSDVQKKMLAEISNIFPASKFEEE